MLSLPRPAVLAALVAAAAWGAYAAHPEGSSRSGPRGLEDRLQDTPRPPASAASASFHGMQDAEWPSMGWTPDGPDDMFAPLLGSTLEVVRTQATYFTRPAAFGQHIKDPEGLRGTLIPISFYRIPHHSKETAPDVVQEAMYACPSRAPSLPPRDPTQSSSGTPALFGSDPGSLAGTSGSDAHLSPPDNWIALVERGGNCSFVDKVRLAQSMGATAVVVGDAPSPGWDSSQDDPGSSNPDPGLANKRLVTMSADGDTSDVQIPSTFITRPSFLDLRRLILDLQLDYEADPRHRSDAHEPNGIEIVLCQDEALWEWPFIDVALILLLLPSLMTLSTIVVQRLRHAQQRRRERAPKLVVQNLPCLIVHGNGVPWEKADPTEPEQRPRRRFISSMAAATGSDRIGGPSSATDHARAALLENESTDVEALALEPGQTTPPDSVVLEGTLSPETSTLLPPGRKWFYSHECAICLSHFVEGDRVRVLPCGHIFHQTEVDEWLLLQKKICPVCKRDVTVPLPGPVPHPQPRSRSQSQSQPQQTQQQQQQQEGSRSDLGTDGDERRPHCSLASPSNIIHGAFDRRTSDDLTQAPTERTALLSSSPTRD